MAFDRDEFIRLLTEYYEFCHRVYWHELSISKAPPGGWPQITTAAIAGLQKNGTAVDLIRHMPYPTTATSPPPRAYTPVLMYDTDVIDYRLDRVHEDIRGDLLEAKPEPYTDRDPPLPASCVCIAATSSRNGYWVVVDTDDGYIYWGDPNGTHDEPEPELNKTLERFKGDEANQWRRWGANVYTPADFFELCRQKFRELRWIGCDFYEVVTMRMNDDWDEADEEHLLLARLMREAGWPGDGEGRGWDRDKFYALLEENPAS